MLIKKGSQRERKMRLEGVKDVWIELERGMCRGMEWIRRKRQICCGRVLIVVCGIRYRG